MRYHSTLHIINDGGRQYAFRYIDHETGNLVEGTISGGESNIDALRRDWQGENTGWDSGFLTARIEMNRREFKSYTKDFPHAGCRPDELQKFIRDNLGK